MRESTPTLWPTRTFNSTNKISYLQLPLQWLLASSPSASVWNIKVSLNPITLPVNSVHTHTHTHIYIYVYIYFFFLFFFSFSLCLRCVGFVQKGSLKKLAFPFLCAWRIQNPPWQQASQGWQSRTFLSLKKYILPFPAPPSIKGGKLSKPAYISQDLWIHLLHSLKKYYLLNEGHRDSPVDILCKQLDWSSGASPLLFFITLDFVGDTDLGLYVALTVYRQQLKRIFHLIVRWKFQLMVG